MKLKKFTASVMTAAILGFGASAALAAPVNVGGVVWDPDYSNDFFAIGTVNENVVTVAGNTIAGYGNFFEVNDAIASGVGGFCPGCELTYTFSGYELIDSLVGVVGEEFRFSGGLLNIYVDSTPNYTALNPASAADGVLFLSLVANTSAFALLGYTDGESLVGSLTVPASGGLGGRGEGYLDAVGGIALDYFNTDSQFGGADVVFTSTFLPRRGDPIDGIYTHSGGLDALANTQDVPEPGIIALLGLGLMGIGAARRYKKTA